MTVVATAANRHESAARLGVKRALLLAALICVAAAYASTVAQESRARSDAAAAEAQPLGMTGWRGEPVVGGKLVCLGGTMASLATREVAPEYSCRCPKGRAAQAVGPSYQNTFQCILVAVSPRRSRESICARR
jgi:hypothetical protein